MMIDMQRFSKIATLSSLALATALAVATCRADAKRADAERADAKRADAERADAKRADAERADAKRAEVERAQVTGQWGGPLDGLRWRRSVESAVAEQVAAAKPKPLLVLHLFGKFDEE